MLKRLCICFAMLAGSEVAFAPDPTFAPDSIEGIEYLVRGVADPEAFGQIFGLTPGYGRKTGSYSSIQLGPPAFVDRRLPGGQLTERTLRNYRDAYGYAETGQSKYMATLYGKSRGEIRGNVLVFRPEGNVMPGSRYTGDVLDWQQVRIMNKDAKAIAVMSQPMWESIDAYTSRYVWLEGDASMLLPEHPAFSSTPPFRRSVAGGGLAVPMPNSHRYALPIADSRFRANPASFGARQALGPGRMFGMSAAGFEIHAAAGELAVQVMGGSEHPVSIGMISILNFPNAAFAIGDAARAEARWREGILTDSRHTLFRKLDAAGSDLDRMRRLVREYSEDYHVLQNLPPPSRSHINGLLKTYLRTR